MFLFRWSGFQIHCACKPCHDAAPLLLRLSVLRLESCARGDSVTTYKLPPTSAQLTVPLSRTPVSLAGARPF